MHLHRLLTRFAPIAHLSFVALLGLALTTPAAAQTRTPAELVAALRAGGHVIYIRHTSTERDYADQIRARMGDCATQRMLSETGWREARDIGQAFARLAIPVADVVSSEYCRAWQTADLAFGRHRKLPALNFEKAETYTPAQTAAMRTRVTPLLATVPPQGQNIVYVGHDDPFKAATGIYPEPMGVAYVLKPDGRGGFEVLGHIVPTAWAGIAAP